MKDQQEPMDQEKENIEEQATGNVGSNFWFHKLSGDEIQAIWLAMIWGDVII